MIQRAFFFDQFFAECDRAPLHSLKQGFGFDLLVGLEMKLCGQFEDMRRTRVTVELGRLGEPHSFAREVVGNLLRGQCLDFSKLLTDVRRLGLSPCRPGK
jgi:hypothetical protein